MFCQYVCLSVTFVILAKMAEPIEIPFGWITRVGERNHVLDGVQIIKRKGQFWGLSGPVKSIMSHCRGVLYAAKK